MLAVGEVGYAPIFFNEKEELSKIKSFLLLLVLVKIVFFFFKTHIFLSIWFERF
jgi:hypothetical protein